MQRLELVGTDAEHRRVDAGVAGDEGADAVARLDQRRGLQVGERLADDGAADAELHHQRRFRGQLGAGAQAAVADAVAQGIDNREREVARPAGGHR